MRKLVLCLVHLILLCAAESVFSQPLVKVSHDTYDSYYSLDHHCPLVVIWFSEASHFLEAKKVKTSHNFGSRKVKSHHFRADAQLPPPRVKSTDYRGTGYVRGHLCPAGDYNSNGAQIKDTYQMSNVVPMSLVTNSGPWKAVEDSCRMVAAQGHVLMCAALPLFEYPAKTKITDDSQFPWRIITEQLDSNHELYYSLQTIGSTIKISVPWGIIRYCKCITHPNETYTWFVWNSQVITKPLRLQRSDFIRLISIDNRQLQVLQMTNILNPSNF